MSGFNLRIALPMAVCAAFALAVAIGLGRFGFAAAYPLMIRDGVMSVRGVGLAQTFHFVGYFIGAAAVVRLPRALTAQACGLGVLASVGLLAITGYAEGTPQICAARLLSGVASGVVMVTASTWLFGVASTAWAPMLYSGAGLGIVAAGESVAFLSGEGATERSAWLVLAATAGAMAIPPLFATAYFRRGRRSPPICASRPDIGPYGLVVVYAAGGFGYVVCATYLPTLAARAAGGLNPIHVFSLFGLCAAPSCLAWIRLDAWMGTKRALATNFALQATGAAMPLLSKQPAALLVSAGLVGGTFMGVVALAMSAGRRHAPSLSYNLMAVLTAAYALGQALGPGLCAVLARDPQGLDVALKVAAGVLGTASAAAFLVRRSETEEFG